MHSNCATEPIIKGIPIGLFSQAMPSNLLVAGVENFSHKTFWSEDSIFTAKDLLYLKALILGVLRDILQIINGGSRDIELKEFTVNPIGSPSSFSVVTIVMPVGKHPSAFLSSLLFIFSSFYCFLT